MESILLQKIDSLLEGSSESLLHLPACGNGKYFEATRGVYPLRDIRATNQAFLTGMAIRAYQQTGDEKYLHWCRRFYDAYREKVTNQEFDTAQDTGMLYSFYAVPMYRLTGDRKYRAIAISAADEVARRFVPNRGYLKAWGRCDSHYPPYVDEWAEEDPFFGENRGLMLIETMMNLPLLFWAYKETKNPFYLRSAMSHIEATKRYLIRRDNTTAHGFRFNEWTGEIYCEENYFGFAKGSYWAKGAALAIYGFALCGRYADSLTPVALGLLDKFAESCGDRLPPWDFRDPEGKTDTAAGAAVLSAIRILGPSAAPYRDFAEKLERRLLARVDTDPRVDGILREQNGREEYDLTGDFFLADALLGNDSCLW